MIIITFFQNNINWIKDIFTIVFVTAGTIIAILTYRRAKATILQPIRTEVIKKQSQLLSELLDCVTKNFKENVLGFDYNGIVKINAFSLLKRYGFKLKDQEEIEKKVMENSAGAIIINDGKNITDFEVIDTFSRKPKGGNQKKRYEKGKKEFENLKKGIVHIQLINYTENYHKFIIQLSDFADNPFLPTDIRKILKTLIEESHTNLTVHIKNALTTFILKFSELYFKGEKKHKISPDGIYNEFNHNCISHKQIISELKKEIRSHLRIDEKL